jgi:hypothetical protein
MKGSTVAGTQTRSDGQSILVRRRLAPQRRAADDQPQGDTFVIAFGAHAPPAAAGGDSLRCVPEHPDNPSAVHEGVARMA